MSNAITREMLDNAFGRWVQAGLKVGALNSDLAYRLEYGSAKYEMEFKVATHDGNRRRVETTAYPHLGCTKQTAYDVLNGMTHAWSMVNTQPPARNENGEKYVMDYMTFRERYANPE